MKSFQKVPAESVCVIDSLLTTLAECLPERFSRVDVTVPTGNFGYKRRLCLVDNESSIIYDPDSVQDMDALGVDLLRQTDIAFVAKMEGLTWQESILNAVIHRMVSR